MGDSMTLAQQLLAIADVLDDVAPIIDRPLLENGVPKPGAILRAAARRLLSDENRGQPCGG